MSSMKISFKSLNNRLRSQWIDYVKRIDLTQRLDYAKRDILLNDNVRLGSCQKEPETIRWIESFAESDVFFDIGANIGAYSLVASIHCKTVFAFEPAIMNYLLLCKNIISNVENKIAANIIPVHLAFSNENKIENLNYVNLNSGKSGHQIKDRITDYNGEPFAPSFRMGVPALTIDAFLDIFLVSAPEHIKIDVDGFELIILQGGKKALSGNIVKSVLVETNRSLADYPNIVALMSECGFTLVAEHSLSLLPNEVNCLFCK